MDCGGRRWPTPSLARRVWEHSNRMNAIANAGKRGAESQTTSGGTRRNVPGASDSPQCDRWRGIEHARRATSLEGAEGTVSPPQRDKEMSDDQDLVRPERELVVGRRFQMRDEFRDQNAESACIANGT